VTVIVVHRDLVVSPPLPTVKLEDPANVFFQVTNTAYEDTRRFLGIDGDGTYPSGKLERQVFLVEYSVPLSLALPK
jgi:hypothetical protein